MKFEKWYDKNYKKLLIIPALLLAFSLIYLTIFSIQNQDIIRKDISLTGGTTITIQTQNSVQELKDYLSDKITDFEVKSISDNAGNQLQLIITVSESESDLLESTLEEYLGYELTEENSSKETTSSSLSSEFYNQLIVAVILAFFWMAAVVFLIFTKNKKVKFWTIILNIILGFFMGKIFLKANPIISGILFVALAGFLIRMYLKNSVPAFAVMLSAFADIVMTLATVNLLGMKISTAGIVAFLMIIGYSVDTDILLTTRLTKGKEKTNTALRSAFGTGTTMTITSIIAVTSALIAVYSFNSVLNQIFTILLIGLTFDLLNTWLTNASIIKWYVEKKK